MRVSDNLSSNSIQMNNNDFRVPNRQNHMQQSSFKEAFKLDINPKYIVKGELEPIAITEPDTLYYSKSLEIVNKP